MPANIKDRALPSCLPASAVAQKRGYPARIHQRECPGCGIASLPALDFSDNKALYLISGAVQGSLVIFFFHSFLSCEMREVLAVDPISAAIIAALAAGAASGATDVARNALVDGYNGIKSFIKKKWGGDSDVSKAVEQLQAKPDSEARKGMVVEEIKAAKVAEDPELIQMAQSLLELVKSMPGGEKIIQSATGTGIAQATHGSTATVIIENYDREKLRRTGGDDV